MAKIDSDPDVDQTQIEDFDLPPLDLPNTGPPEGGGGYSDPPELGLQDLGVGPDPPNPRTEIEVPFDLKEFAFRLAACVNEPTPNPEILPFEVRKVVQLAVESFRRQEAFLEIDPPINICGDIHGQFTDLLRIFKHCAFPPRVNYLFLGDYVDRGRYSVETILLLLSYKVLYPHNFFLLRGNHEAEEINRVYGFYEECNNKFDVHGPAVFKLFQEAFNWMPAAALVAGQILCMHGGLSPELSTVPGDWEAIRAIQRPTGVPVEGLLCDLLWADPRPHEGYQPNVQRKISVSFGEDVVKQFCDTKQIDLVCRAHEVVEEGYEFFAGMKLVTLFSAPNYCDKYDNIGAVMNVAANLEVSFFAIHPKRKAIKTKGRGQTDPRRN